MAAADRLRELSGDAPGEVAGEEPVRGPLADPAHLHELAHDLIVGELVEEIERNPAVVAGKRNILVPGKGRMDVPVYRLAQLRAGDHAEGPAIVEEDYFTCSVLAGWSFVVSNAGDILIQKKG